MVKSTDESRTESECPTTQRAYTLRLRGHTKGDPSWREPIWQTHLAVNAGARAFGDWLLTLRGGLDPSLAEPSASEKDRDTVRKTRRILLAVSWMSVEDSRGAPAKFRITHKGLSDAERRHALVSRLRSTLARRGVPAKEIESWVKDCEPSLSARIRDDAVWVDRAAMFEACAAQYAGLTCDYATDTVMAFFGPEKEYFALPTSGEDDDEGGGVGSGGASESPEFRTLARQWCSTNFGSGEKSDTGDIVRGLRTLADVDLSRFNGREKSEIIAEMARAVDAETPDMDGLRVAIGWKTGRSSSGRLAIDNLPDRLTTAAIDAMQAKFREEAEKKDASSGMRMVPVWMPGLLKRIESACGMPFKVGTGRDHIGEYSVMLDHAARRVSIAHSWIKRAEAERVRFEEDARKLDSVPPEVRAWLDGFIEERTGTSGAASDGDGYRIRRRALGCWDDVVRRWASAERLSKKDREKLLADANIDTDRGPESVRLRIALARQAQAEDETGKFGDIQLFERLAEEGAKVVWLKEGKPDPDPLKHYVAAHEARFKQKRFKVPAYRHPDALRNPVFCDFGNSRWSVEYGVHQGDAKTVDAATKTHERLLHRKQDAENKGKPWTAGDEQKLRDAHTKLAWLTDSRGLHMGLWDGSKVEKIPLRWSSKRLAKDLGLHARLMPDEARVVASRADRLGRAAAGARKHQSVEVAGLFEQGDWNARLQAPRRELNALAKRLGDEPATPEVLDRLFRSDKGAGKMRDRINWLATFSAKLECRGPFIEYAARFAEDATAKPFVSRKGEYAVKHAENDKRKGHAKLVLSRLPGLRILSVDLGHRYAAACTVWEAITHPAFLAEIAGREIAAGGAAKDDLFCHTRHTDERGQSRTTIYRRVGPDTLPGGSAHPAPWARLDRQFTIKLQGEERPPRKATEAEREMVRTMERSLGRVRDDSNALPPRVDLLMAEAVRSARLALRRHGDAARIAHAFMPNAERYMPGGGRIAHTPESRAATILDALIRWHGLASSGNRVGWTDPDIAAAWQKHIGPMSGISLMVAEDDDAPPKQRRKRLEAALKPLAESLARSGNAGQSSLYQWWKEFWEKRDALWPEHLGRLRRWLLPRGLHARQSDSTEEAVAKQRRRLEARHVGGLSLDRISTIRELWQVQKAHHMRAEPTNPRAGIERMEGEAALGWKFGDRTLQTMERMREQRVKQTASRIVEAALGAGRHKMSREGRDRLRPQEQKDPPCHAIVIENLRNYRPEEVQTRRENRQLMNWSAGKVRKYLEEGCQLHGLHLREVLPNYTSRQCSRTGLPGVRCQEVRINGSGKPELFRWDDLVERSKGKGDAESWYIVGLDEWLQGLPPEARPASVIVPRRAGELFLPAPSWNELKKITTKTPLGLVHADLNAAANVGLRALLDPDFGGRWWYVACDTATGEPAKDKCAGAAWEGLHRGRLLEPPKTEKGKAGRVKRAGDKINAWRDLADSGGWRDHGAYWNGVNGVNGVKARAARALARRYGLSDFAVEEVASPDTPW